MDERPRPGSHRTRARPARLRTARREVGGRGVRERRVGGGAARGAPGSRARPRACSGASSRRLSSGTPWSPSSGTRPRPTSGRPWPASALADGFESFGAASLPSPNHSAPPPSNYPDGRDGHPGRGPGPVGRRAAFQRLVERHSAGVFQLAFRLTGSESDAEDVVQETFLKVYRELRRFESRSSFRTWLHRVTVNCSYDLLRKRPRMRLEPIDASETEAGWPPEPEAEAAGRPDRVGCYGAEVHDRIQAAMEGLYAGRARRHSCSGTSRGVRSKRSARRWACGSAPPSTACFGPSRRCGGH